MKPLKLGTRGSPLAVAQSTMVARALEQAHPGLVVELVLITTTGDRMQTGSVKPVESTKAIFTKELEEAMLDGRIDFAVHSAKDLSAVMPEGLVLGAVPERAHAEDVLVSRDGLESVSAKERVLIGTGSLRRSLQWAERFPSSRCEALRGNIDTRIRRLRERNDWDGIILARAGLERLQPDLAGLEVCSIPHEWILPAPGQGALALQCRSDDPSTLDLIAALNHDSTRRMVEIERAFLCAMDAGCHVPLGACASAIGASDFCLQVVYYPEGESLGRRGSTSGSCDDAAMRVCALAREIKSP